MQENFRQFLDRLRQRRSRRPAPARGYPPYHTLVDQAKTRSSSTKVIGCDMPVVSGIIRFAEARHRMALGCGTYREIEDKLQRASTGHSQIPRDLADPRGGALG